MEKVTKVLKKLNLDYSGQQITLSDLMPLSLAEVRNKAGSRLSREEAQLLHRAAIKEKQNNILFAARSLTRANPLLRKEMGVARYHGATPYGYDDIIMPRADEFTAPGTVSSMFSPAGYLTELYREARGLHQADSVHNLDKRRPDLAKLTLTQENLDKEISTLSLANDQLETALMANAGLTKKTKYYEALATSRNSGVTPYNAPFERVRESLAQQGFSLPDNILSKGADSAAQLALNAGISPELYAILTEKTDGLSEAETEALLKKNFPGVDTENLMNLDALANYYELPRDEIQEMLERKISEIAQTPDVYRNNKLVSPIIDADGKITVSGITRKYTQLPEVYHYVDLIPQGGNQFLVNFAVVSYYTKARKFDIARSADWHKQEIYHNSNFSPLAGWHYSIPVTLDSPLTENSFIRISRHINYAQDSSSSTYIDFTPFNAVLASTLWLLTFNKTLRLAKACGLTPLETQRALTRLRVTDKDTDSVVMHRFCEALHYRKRYSIDTETALMLCNADISQVSDDGQLSQFDRLFNNPPLNGVTYTLGGDRIPMLPDAEDPRREVLKRAFRVDNAELWSLHNINYHGNTADIAIDNISDNLNGFYLARILADTHGFTVTQLYNLLFISKFKLTNILNITDLVRREIITFLYQTTQWLSAQNITVEQLVMLLTTDAPETPTKEMNTLLDALRNGGIDSTETTTLLTTMAPVIAAAMQMESPEQGEALLHWLDNKHPDGVPVTSAVWPLITKESPSSAEQIQIAAWCQALAQRVLVIRTFALSDTELWVLSKDAPADTISALHQISDFHNLINRCGEHAGTVLNALQSSTLTVAILAKALNLSESVITQALPQAGLGISLTNWSLLALLPARLDMADALHITPKDITNLLTVSDNATPSYADLTTLAGLLQAGLNEQQTTQLQSQLEPRLSEALSGEYRVRIMGKPLANRDDIWRNLLIDGKVSAAIITTRLADAIAGIQLYINRTIAGDEPAASSAVLERQFFKDWDTYNKRYSTWAGVSQLVYYPENYIDPTIRIGQTGMMSTMLEQLSQSELNSDTLEDGFRQYLTAFEQVANLNVVSGYHDAVDIDEGNTWFIGTSQTEPKKYYWRKADHSKCQNGKFTGNAWSDWKEITCAVNPYQGMVRPVIFRSRLYLFWIEKQVQKNADNTDDISVFNLKLTHIKYDGSWASPFSYNVTDDITPMEKNPIGLYCTGNNDTNLLTIACYQIKDEYDFKPDDSGAKHDDYCGWSVLSDMTIYIEPDMGRILTYISPQLDTFKLRKVNAALQSYGGTLTAETQPTPNQVSLELNTKRFHITKVNNRSILEIDSEVNAVVELNNLAPVFIKEYLQHLQKTPGIDHLHNATGVNYTSQNDRFPVGECTFQILTWYDDKAELLVSIPGDYQQFPAFYRITCTIEDEQGTKFPEVTLKLLKSDDSRLYFYGAGLISSSELIGLKNPTYKLTDTYESNDEIGSFKYKNIEDIARFHGPDNVLVEISTNDKPVNTLIPYSYENIIDYRIPRVDSTYQFGKQQLDVTDLIKEDGKLNLDLAVRFSGVKLTTYRKYTLLFNFPAKNERFISLHSIPDGAQYMEWDAYRTRLNTLFARQLIERANRGIEAVLSPETQNLREPKPGVGTYVTLTLKAYDPAIHGSDRKFTIQRGDVFTLYDVFPVADGMLSQNSTTDIKLFIPNIAGAYSNYSADTSKNNTFFLRAYFQSGDSEWIRFYSDGHDGWKLDKNYKGKNGTFLGLESVSGLSQPDEPMDFSGANALYFWELFYYTPMMVAMRLLQEQNFTEANHWLSYIWQPAATGAGDWRVRPLKEDTSWNADPMDSVDPDAVAQNDPMHYKVSTLMKLLDLLLARGDSAYRMLERDTLNEAKMWYMQALGLLGEKPLTVISSAWGNPALSDAADKTQAKQFHDEISRIRSGGLLPEIRSANTLTGLFLPQQNEKLLGYWQTLGMRLFNLRNDLSIDGQPLSLPIFAAPADPAALLSAAAAASGGGKALPNATVPALRFPQILESARSLTGQLMQFGSTLQGLIERQDAEAMSELLQNQAGALMLSSLRMQEQTLAELDAEKNVLEHSRAGAQSRFESYRALYDENISAAEKRTMDLYLSSSVLTTSIEALNMAAAAADMAPNVFGMAVGGSRWGGIPKAIGSGIGMAAAATKITADNISQSEAWRRRRQEWEIQKNNAESDVKQIDAQLESLTVRRTATEMQREHLEIQQAQTQAQLEFLQRKFSNKALYSWLRGRLASIYYRFYDLTAARCMMAEAAFTWQTGETTRYIKPGAWQSSNAGLMAGESLLLNLTEMEQTWLKWDRRALEVTRTVSLAEVYKGYEESIILPDTIKALLNSEKPDSTPKPAGLSITADKQLHAAFSLGKLNIKDDYPSNLGSTRRIKQVSVTLPALVGPYQDVRAVLSYGGDVKLPDGCKAVAVSHGMNDSGQFQLDFNDGRWLPFEGIPVDNTGSLTLSFPGATGDKQKVLLLSLSDIIVHIRYTIR